MGKKGRPTKFKKEFVEQVYKLTLKGCTDKELADFFSISESTLNLWKLEHFEFSESLQKGKDEFDSDEAEASLLKRVRGFEYDEITKEISPKADPETGGEQLRITKRVTKLVIPDVAAQFIWLKNRRAARWRDKHEVQHSEWNINVIVKKYSEDEKRGS